MFHRHMILVLPKYLYTKPVHTTVETMTNSADSLTATNLGNKCAHPYSLLQSINILQHTFDYQH